MRTDEQEILAATRAFEKAWNAGDAKAAASFYTSDGVRVGAGGDVQHGRAEIERAYEDLLHGPFAGASVQQATGEVRLLGCDLALWRGGIEIGLPGGGPTMRGHVVQVMTKDAEGAWLILEAHPKLFPPPRAD
jgi:uncharacterized protein (TIGR02246 family)